MAAIQDRLKPS